MGNFETFAEVAEEIPRYESFYSVPEHEERDRRLAAEHDHVSRERVGTTRSGEPITALEIGDGARTALWYAAPHPNEPIGCMTIDFLAHKLARDDAFRESLDYSFTLVKFADKDGVLLNQGWFDGPFTISNYAQNFFRPAGHDQVEWTFPLTYRTLEFDDPLPETRALMSLIEDRRPDFVYSLHNAGFGGCYYYMSEPLPSVFDDLREIARARDVPLHLGEPEAPFITEFDPAIFQTFSATEEYEYFDETVDKDPAEVMDIGGCSYDYATRFNEDVFVLTTELPYFYDPRIEDEREVDATRRELLLEGVETEEALLEFLSEEFSAVEELLPESRIYHAIAELVEGASDDIEAKREWIASDSELEATATTAQAFDAVTVSPFYRFLHYGPFLRLLDHARMGADERAAVDRLASAKRSVEQRFHDYHADLLADLEYSVIPIRDLVAIQVRAGLTCSSRLAARNQA